MSGVQQLFHPQLKLYTIFYSYRWLAWVAAVVAIAVPGVPAEPLPIYIWLLIFTGVLNLMATALAQAYVRVAQRRPFVLAFDVLLGLSLLWASAGEALPFLPYALGTLILPALLLGWRGKILTGVAFVLLNQAVLQGMNASEPWSMVGIRAAIPLVFMLTCVLLPRIAEQFRTAAAAPTGSVVAFRVGSDVPPPVEHNFRAAASRPFSSVENQPAREPVTSEPSVAALEATGITARFGLRSAANQGNLDSGFSLKAMPIRPEVELTTVLNQLASTFRRDSDVVLHLSLLGDSQRLSPVTQMTLVKLAQEALLNIQQHAQAHSALLTLNYEPYTVSLTVQDDGVGLLDGTHERPGVHALRAMHYRLSELDGRLEVFEGESGGVTVRGVIPLDTP